MRGEKHEPRCFASQFFLDFEFLWILVDVDFKLIRLSPRHRAVELQPCSHSGAKGQACDKEANQKIDRDY